MDNQDSQDSPEYQRVRRILKTPQSDTIRYILIDSSNIPTLTEKESIVRSDGQGGYINDMRMPVTIDDKHVIFPGRCWFIMFKTQVQEGTYVLEVVLRGIQVKMNVEVAKNQFISSMRDFSTKPLNQCIINAGSFPPDTLFSLQACCRDIMPDLPSQKTLDSCIRSCYYKTFYEIVPGNVFAYLLCENTVNMAVMLFALDHYKSNPNKGLKKPSIPMYAIVNMNHNMLDIILTRNNQITEYKAEVASIIKKANERPSIEEVRNGYKRFGVDINGSNDLVFLYDLISGMVSGAELKSTDGIICVLDIIKTTKCVSDLANKLLCTNIRRMNFMANRMARSFRVSTGNINVDSTEWTKDLRI